MHLDEVGTQKIVRRCRPARVSRKPPTPRVDYAVPVARRYGASAALNPADLERVARRVLQLVMGDEINRPVSGGSEQVRGISEIGEVEQPVTLPSLAQNRGKKT